MAYYCLISVTVFSRIFVPFSPPAVSLFSLPCFTVAVETDTFDMTLLITQIVWLVVNLCVTYWTKPELFTNTEFWFLQVLSAGYSYTSKIAHVVSPHEL